MKLPLNTKKGKKGKKGCDLHYSQKRKMGPVYISVKKKNAYVNFILGWKK